MKGGFKVPMFCLAVKGLGLRVQYSGMTVKGSGLRDSIAIVVLL